MEKTAEAAAALYDEVRKADVPKQRSSGSDAPGSIIARNAAGIPLLVENNSIRRTRRFSRLKISCRPGNCPVVKFTDALSAELPALAPAAEAVGLLSVLADRNDGGLPPVVLNAAKSGDKQLRIAAVGVVRSIG